jgi:hypothetical protein
MNEPQARTDRQNRRVLTLDWNFVGTIDEAIAELTALRDKYGGHGEIATDTWGDDNTTIEWVEK